mmetsp:Transcript_5061/g.12818  ORF Transcript_5061/g.12818 Transcript_5061/m.12818 type:complete len:379 (-) Transcript_5061:208-1344(-)
MINGTYSTATSSSPLTSSPRPRPRPRRRMRMDRNTTSSSSSARSRTTMGAMVVIVSAMMALTSQAFVVPPSTAVRTKAATTTTTPSQQHSQQPHPLCAFVADRVDREAFEEKRKRGRDETNGSSGDKNDEKNASQSAWRPSKNGGFIPNLKAKASSIKILRRIPSTASRSSSNTEPITSVDDDQEIYPRVQKNQQTGVISSNDDNSAVTSTSTQVVPGRKKEPLKIWTVDDIQRYKEVVADEKNAIVVVRFYAPWCRACRAIQSAYRSLPKQYYDNNTRQRIKFVEVPVTKDNTYLHRGLGVPSLPYGHIYHPTGGLVEEMKISKNHFGNFQQILAEYVDGQCQVEYENENEDEDSATICRRRLRSSSSSSRIRRPEP